MSDRDGGGREAPVLLTLRPDSPDAGWPEAPSGLHSGRERVAARLLADDAETLEEATRILSHLRVHLAELDRREQSLNGQLTLFDQEQRALRLRMQRLEEDYSEQSALLAARQDELERREAERDEQSGDLDRRADELNCLAAQLDADRAALRDELRQELEAERRQLEIEQQQWAGEREGLAAERQRLDAEQADWQERRAREVFELQEQLDALRRERGEELDQREAALDQREVDVEKRARFHEDHLARLRATLDQTRRELELQRQQQRVWIEEVEHFIRLRLAQLRKFRGLIELREAECRRGWEELAEARRSHEQTEIEARADRETERAALDGERRSLAADAERQQDLLRLREQELLRRGARLDQLREDLERTHRASLVLRAEAEESWRRLTEQVAPDQSPALSDAARRLVDDYLASAEASLEAERQETAAARRALDVEQADLRREREELVATLAGREQRLREREQSLARQTAQLMARERETAEARSALREDRLAAQQVIQELLVYLESAVGAAELRRDAPLDPADPIR